MNVGALLLKHKLLDDTGLVRASDAQTNGARLDQAAVALGLVSETDVLRAWSTEVGMPLVDLETAE
ncbi:MAG: hypothetical protein MI725_00085, partial [Pirellulales bacterium]|nr:hypothetical protein [Pirellulales bacterium]